MMVWTYSSDNGNKRCTDNFSREIYLKKTIQKTEGKWYDGTKMEQSCTYHTTTQMESDTTK
jgi:hypothetical protein